jgi:cytochrome c peroxidase
MKTRGWALAWISAVTLMGCEVDGSNPMGTQDSIGEMFPDLSAVLAIDLAQPDNYAAITYPAHYGPPVRGSDNAPDDNPVTDRGATLGRVLFHDTSLSLNRTVSCASCHVQELGFTDSETLSTGFEGGETGSHSMRLANANFYTGEVMFWDGRADDLEDQSLQPVVDRVEMGFDDAAGGLPSLIARLEATTYYPALFNWAFGSPEVTETGMRRALAQYIRSMVSSGSRFDTGLEAAGGVGPGPGPGPVPTLPNFTAEENLGLRLFSAPPPTGAGCAGCHQLPTLALTANSGSNGLDGGQNDVFKSPSLKNVGVTGPYMHDGRFQTLEEVVEHYNTGVQVGPELDRRLRQPDGAPLVLNLNVSEVAALVSFLHTLTDDALLSDPRFSNPFVN